MNAPVATVAQRAELHHHIGLLAEAGLSEAEAAKALGIPRDRYAEAQRRVGAWHALEAARMRRAESAWRNGRKPRGQA